MTWHISWLYCCYCCLHTYIVCFKETILVLWRGVTIFENKGFRTSIVLMAHSTLFFAPLGPDSCTLCGVRGTSTVLTFYLV